MRTLVVTVLLSAAGILAILMLIADPADLAEIRAIPAGAFALALALLFTSHVAGGIRLAVLVRASGERLGVLRATRAYLLGLFSAAITPGGAGHHPAMAYAMQRDGVSPSKAWSSAFYSSAIDMLMFGIVAPVALLPALLGERAHPYLLLALPIGGIYVSLWYLYARRFDLLERILHWTFRFRPLARWREGASAFSGRMRESVETINGGSTRLHVGLVVLSLVVHVGGYGIFWVFAASLGAVLPIPTFLGTFLLIDMIAAVIPTPGGSGFIEFITGYLFAGLAPASALVPALVAWRALQHYLSLVFGPLLGGIVIARAITGERSAPADASRSAAD